ncbi:MAG: leucine-rich repeat domain-containing protein [Ruminococcaceae bacterium]|nr:leucine-rich repeat domain-containing protein [Oscillospiraceae bacterium]
MKKIVSIVLALITVLALTVCICACSKEEEKPHAHDFSSKSIAEKYLKTAGTCGQASTYYYSCYCGEKGSETFEVKNVAHELKTTYSEDDLNGNVYHVAVSKCEKCDYSETTREIHVFSNKKCDCGAKKTSKFTAGLYNSETGELVYGWDALMKADVGILDASGKIVAGKELLLDGDLVLPDDSKAYSNIATMAFRGCANLNKVAIPAHITDIPESAFEGCTSLEYVKIPVGVVSVGNNAFSGCAALKSVNIPNSVKNIGGYAFANCTGVNNISVGEGVTVLNPGVFSGLVNLQSITLTKAITAIRENAFYNCSYYTTVKFGGTKAEWDAVTKDQRWAGQTANCTVVTTD